MTYRHLGDTMPTAPMPLPYAAPFVPTTAFYASVIPQTWRQTPGAIFSPHGWGPEMRPPYYEHRVYYPRTGGQAPAAPFLGRAPTSTERYLAPAALGAAVGAIWALVRTQMKDPGWTRIDVDISKEMAKTGALGAAIGLLTAYLIQLRGTRSVEQGTRVG